jgi:uncharacterized protein
LRLSCQNASISTWRLIVESRQTAAGAEIDLVIERAGEVAFAIEIRRANAPKVEQGFYWGAADIGAARKIVVIPSGDPYPLREGAEVMPLLMTMKEVAARSC